MVGSCHCHLLHRPVLKLLSVRMLDTVHSLLIFSSIWIYLITRYGSNETMIDIIPMCVCYSDVRAHDHSEKIV